MQKSSSSGNTIWTWTVIYPTVNIHIMTLGQKEASLGLFLTLSTNRNISSKSCTLTSGIWFKQYCQSKQSISCLNVCCTSFKKGLAGWNFHENLSWNLHFYCNLTGKYLNACSHEALLHCRQEGQHWTEVIHTSKREQGIFLSIWCLVFFVFCICWTVFVSCLQPHQLRVEIHRSPVWMQNSDKTHAMKVVPGVGSHNAIQQW